MTAATAMLALGCAAPKDSVAAAARVYTYNAEAPVPGKTNARGAAASARRASTPRAPSGPPLVARANPAQGAVTGEVESPGGDASSSAPSSGGDPLVENGLGSPLCSHDASALSPASQRNCATSGFEASGVPTGNYGLDVHIDTGALGFTAATLEQDYLIGPVWMGLVWIVHTLVVALEWGFTLDLLGGTTMDSLERSLRAAQVAFTQPWLVLVLALASLAAAYNGLVRRRVAETLGQAALMGAMIVGGLWVIADPAGTVGALGRWVDATSVGTLGAVVEGSPAQAPRTLADSMQGLFAGVVVAPWCYLEFGNVRWCTEPALLDRRLHAAALRIAAAAQAAPDCAEDAATTEACEVLTGEQPAARAQSAKLLSAARTNGELFLALPADQAARNSINDHASLLSVLCGGSADATDCRGPTAQEAEFRTQGGTAPRVGGLLLIALGSLGMLLLLGYIALHLLGSELVALVYLLLAPVAVIAPALGDGGRAAFRAWAARLLGAVTSKLLFSFLLGVVLLLTRTLMAFPTLGWWTRWLLVSAMWWGAYSQRRRALGFVHGELRASTDRIGGRGQQTLHASAVHHDSLARRVQRQLESPVAAARVARWARGKLSKPAPDVTPHRSREHLAGARAGTFATQQATLMLAREYEQAREDLAGAPQIQAPMQAKRAQLQRIQAARELAIGGGDERRAAVLGFRAQRVEHEISGVQERLSAARETVRVGDRMRRVSGQPHTRAAVEQRSRWLDAQAALPASGPRSGARAAKPNANGHPTQRDERRDYAALASLVGYGREQYERLDSRHRREARLQIDRELVQRRERLAGKVAATPAQESGRVSTTATGTVPPRTTSPRDSRPGDTPSRDASSRAIPESTVMRDAHEVARGRKRQLGFDR
jgi:hypothetical protein